jgi:hypothetical protein
MGIGGIWEGYYKKLHAKGTKGENAKGAKVFLHSFQNLFSKIKLPQLLYPYLLIPL